MPKVLLVEDDNNLREIFEMRLQAEGYETLTAGNGEEGLTVAMAEKPDLIISDVMMPKLSGFEMLENLRAAPEGKDAKVIMMTALGQAEDQARGEKLGVIKYLVKSQATLDDFARVVREVLPPADDAPAAGDKSTESSVVNKESEKKMPEEPTTPTNPDPAAPAEPTVPPPAPEPAAPAPDPAAPGDQQSTAAEQSTVNSQINDFVTNTPGADSAAPSADSVTPPADTTPSDPAPAAADPVANPFAPSEPTATDNPVATPGAPDMSLPAGDTASTDAPAVPPATPPVDNPPATPPQTDAPVTPPADSSGTI